MVRVQRLTPLQGVHRKLLAASGWNTGWGYIIGGLDLLILYLLEIGDTSRMWPPLVPDTISQGEDIV